ncbi:MAG: MurT ligase domain-containing protein [Candidatus Limnocylindrales bacterium]
MERPPLRTTAAIVAGKAARSALQLLGRGATALPGLVALAVDPDTVARLSRALPHGTVGVTGTNGKTTTTRMLSDIVRAAGWAPVHNRSGSNLDRGLAAALLADATWSGESRGDVGIYELDEASVPRILARLHPRILVVTNLFRDQLDRYFEIDALARRLAAAIGPLPENTTLVLNADDPIVAYLGNAHRGPVLYFGVDDPQVGAVGDAARLGSQGISDASRCPRCHGPLAYTRVVLAHVGDWSCAPCGLARPPRDLAAARLILGPSATELRIAGTVGAVLDPIVIPVPGAYNAYNALAALAAARALDIALPTATRALAGYKPAFGRLEAIAAEGRSLRLVLVKNPAGFNAAIGALLETGRHPRILAALNDRDADSRDVSWIWDADFEALAPSITHAVVTGLRARDMALRLKYAGLPSELVMVVDGWAAAIRAAIADAPVGEEIVVLTTYTAMLALRDALARLGYVKQFWED